MPAPQAPSNTLATWMLVAAAIIVQLALAGTTLPLSEVLSDNPLFHIDGAYHWLQLHVARELAEQGRLTGYDPYFAAGYLGGVTLNASAKFPALLAVLLGGSLSEIQVYKLFVMFAAVVGPSMATLAARIAKANVPSTLIATALAFCIWWASAIRWYHTAGMVSFILACYLGLPYIALVIRSIEERTFAWSRAVGLGALGAVGMLVHPLFPIPVAFVTLVHLAAMRRDVDWLRTIAFLSAVSTLSVLPNVPWILAMARADETVAGVVQYQTRVDIMTIPKEMIGLWRGDAMGSKVYFGLVVASLGAALGAATAAQRRFARIYLVTWLALAVFAAVGAALPGAPNVQPNRFSVAAYLFLLVPAGFGVSALWSWLRDRGWRLRMVGLGFAAACAGSFGLSLVEVAREVSYAPVGHYGMLPPEIRPLGEKSAWLIDWLKRNTTADARILFETSLGRIHDEAHMAGYYAIMSDREFIGGPYPFMFEASFWDGVAFGKQIDSIRSDEFFRDLDAYNVGWIVAHSLRSKAYLSALPNVALVAGHDDVAVYRATRSHSYFAVGTGRVAERGINRLVLDDLEGEEIVIKYHYVAGLSADGAARVEPVLLPISARPFVRVYLNGARRVVLSMR